MGSQANEITFQSIINREPESIFFSPEEVENLRKERILVTGAGGSIGSQIIRFISDLEEITYLATDRDEGALHSLSLQLDSRALFESPHLALLDIRDDAGIEQIFDSFQPTLIFHAAALKHLNVLQKQPREATLTNVFGSANLVDHSVKAGIKKFVNISTDKAANPKNVLGYSKRMAELYVSSKRSSDFFGFTSCRFGNVFNSRGSVIETFVHQITNNKPVTLTDPNISRYFMSSEEAAYLTIKSTLINEGDVHVFDMGSPISLHIVIENLQKVLGKQSSILITGLRDGEKLFEDLFGPTETPFRTSEARIRCANLISDVEWNRPILNLIEQRIESEITLELAKCTTLEMS